MAWDPKRYHQGGEIMIDHRASPGLPPEIARQCGFDPALAGEGKLLETATMTCAHCKIAVVKNPFRARARERCEKCDHYVCDFCYAQMHHPDYLHTPYEKLRDDIITAGDRGIILGSPMDLLRGHKPAPAKPVEVPPASTTSPSDMVARGLIGRSF